MARDMTKKQNLVAVNDDLWQRMEALQALYQIDGKPIPMDMLLDRALEALAQKIDEDQRNEQ